MNAFAHKDDKGKINLGNESDLTGIGDGTAFGAIKAINNDLTANNNKFEADYQNGKYGFTINGIFYEIGGGSNMYNLDYSGFVNVKTAGNYTATKDGRLIVNVIDSAGGNITINGHSIIPEASQSSGVGTIHFDLPIKKGDVIISTFATNQLGRYTNIDFIPLAN